MWITRKSNNTRLLLAGLSWSRDWEEVRVEHAANSVILEVLSFFGSVVYLHVHAVAIPEEYPMSLTIAHLYVDRVAAVEI